MELKIERLGKIDEKKMIECPIERVFWYSSQESVPGG